MPTHSHAPHHRPEQQARRGKYLLRLKAASGSQGVEPPIPAATGPNQFRLEKAPWRRNNQDPTGRQHPPAQRSPVTCPTVTASGLTGLCASIQPQRGITGREHALGLREGVRPAGPAPQHINRLHQLQLDHTFRCKKIKP